LRRGEGTGYIGIRRLQVRLLPAAQAAVAQWIEQRTNTWADDSRRRKFAEWRRHELLRTTVAGSSPASGASYCSSIGRAKFARAASSLCKKNSGVVKVRDSSVERSEVFGEGWVRVPHVACDVSYSRTDRSRRKRKEDRQECLSHKMPGWRSAGILLLQRSGDEPPRPWANIPPGLMLAGASCGPVGGSRRGRGAQTEVCATRSWTWCRAGLLRLMSGRLWVRFPPGRCGPVAQWIERLMSLT
jgi:hypothetical protein